MDALRYGLVHLYELGAKYHLEDVIDITEFRKAKLQDDERTFSTRDFGDDYETSFTMHMRF
jgi:hypothetical protein